MPLSPADAIERARSALAPHSADAGAAYRVRRLDLPEGAYFLVLVGKHIACIDARTGAMLASAATSQSSPVSVSSDEALRRAGAQSGSTAELIWAPGRVSQSMFDPVWSVNVGTRTVYVDQRGRVRNELREKQPGGGPG